METSSESMDLSADESLKGSEIEKIMDDTSELLARVQNKLTDNNEQKCDTQTLESLRSNNSEVRKLVDSVVYDNHILRQQNKDLKVQVGKLKDILDSATKKPPPDQPSAENNNSENIEESTPSVVE